MAKDSVSQDNLGNSLTPNPNKKPVKRTRTLIPARNEINTDTEGNTTIIQHGPQVTGTLAHIHNPLLHRTANMMCQGGSRHGCDYPATDAIRDTSRPRGSTIAVCKQHLGKHTRAAIEEGRELEVTRLTPKNTQDLKKLQAQEAEKTNWKVAATLYEQGVPEEDALAFNMKGSPGRVPHGRKGAINLTPSKASLMGEQEAADYNAARAKTQKESPLKNIDLFLEKRGGPGSETTVKPPKKSPKVKEKDAPLGEGTGTMDEVYRMYKAGDSNWVSKAKEYGVHPTLITRDEPVVPVKRNQEFMDRLLYSKSPERMQKAITNVSEDQAEQVIQANAQNKMAEKQRAIQAKRAALSSRPGLPSRRNTPFALGSGENKGIEPPK